MISRPPYFENADRDGMAWCACCGEIGMVGGACVEVFGWSGLEQGAQGRCRRHIGRNPCAIEGCKRTTAAPCPPLSYQLDGWLCSEHWRAYVPPRSRARRAVQHLWRIHRRQGDWSPEQRDRYWRLWFAIVARARRRSAAGHIDIAEIERLFGL